MYRMRPGCASLPDYACRSASTTCCFAAARARRDSQTQLGVHLGGGGLDDRERPQEGAGEAVPRDLEVLEGALGLGAPVAALLDLDLAHGVGLDAVSHGARLYLPRSSLASAGRVP